LRIFWDSNLKEEVKDFATKFFTCKQVKIDHQQLARLVKLLEVSN